MTGYIRLRQKMYSYLKDDGNSEKKAKDKRKCVIRREFKFEDYKKCLKNNKILRSHKGLKVEHTMYSLKRLTRLH